MLGQKAAVGIQPSPRQDVRVGWKNRKLEEQDNEKKAC
jgi:hypothetical protein